MPTASLHFENDVRTQSYISDSCVLSSPIHALHAASLILLGFVVLIVLYEGLLCGLRPPDAAYLLGG